MSVKTKVTVPCGGGSVTRFAARERASVAELGLAPADPRIRQLDDLEQVDDVEREGERADCDARDGERAARGASDRPRGTARSGSPSAAAASVAHHAHIVSRGAALREADVDETVVEVAAVGRVHGHAVYFIRFATTNDGVDDRDGEHEQRQERGRRSTAVFSSPATATEASV